MFLPRFRRLQVGSPPSRWGRADDDSHADGKYAQGRRDATVLVENPISNLASSEEWILGSHGGENVRFT